MSTPETLVSAIRRVGVLGAAGRMGRTTCDAVVAAPGLELVAVADPSAVGDEISGCTVLGGVADLIEVGVSRYLRRRTAASLVWPLPDHGLAALLEFGGLEFEKIRAQPTLYAFWWPRFERLAAWYVDYECRRRQAGAALVSGDQALQRPHPRLGSLP